MQTEQRVIDVTVIDVAVSEGHALIGSDRVEGTPVYRINGERIGRIEKLMIDKLTGNVAFAVMSFGGFLGMGEAHLPVPWSMLSYNTALGGYEADIEDSQLQSAPHDKPADGEDFETRLGQDQLLRYYNTAPDWYDPPAGRE